MKIEKILHQSYNGEVATVADSILKTSQNHDWSTDSFISKVFQNIQTEGEKLSLAIKQDKAVSELEDRDDKRDTALRALFNLCSGYRYHPNEDIRAAAHTVFLVFSRYGIFDIIAANYAQESALIESLLKDLDAEDIKAAIALLAGLAETIAKVRTAQDNFTNTFVAYSEEKARTNGKQTATKLKVTLLRIINNELVTYLRAMTLAAPDTYGDLAAATTQIIADNNDKVQKRKVKKDAVDTE